MGPLRRCALHCSRFCLVIAAAVAGRPALACRLARGAPVDAATLASYARFGPAVIVLASGRVWRFGSAWRFGATPVVLSLDSGHYTRCKASPPAAALLLCVARSPPPSLALRGWGRGGGHPGRGGGHPGGRAGGGRGADTLSSLTREVGQLRQQLKQQQEQLKQQQQHQQQQKEEQQRQTAAEQEEARRSSAAALLADRAALEAGLARQLAEWRATAAALLPSPPPSLDGPAAGAAGAAGAPPPAAGAGRPGEVGPRCAARRISCRPRQPARHACSHNNLSNCRRLAAACSLHANCRRLAAACRCRLVAA